MVRIVVAGLIFAIAVVILTMLPHYIAKWVSGLFGYKPNGWCNIGECPICWTNNHDIGEPCPYIDGDTPGMEILKKQLEDLEG